MASAFPLSSPSTSTPLLAKSSGTSDAPVKHKMSKSTDETNPKPDPEMKCVKAVIAPEASVAISTAAPVVIQMFANAATTTTLKILFSKTFLVNQPKSSLSMDGTGFRVIMYNPRLPYPAAAL
eukprot:CAMPEP_0197738668 /NCGR_PEP_ID=MMETSP1435-20131217/15807_1 /TAXON_ID=426625 /ORGANISM="Chaetoceros brevis, Strain CCMP164" /LENGTH=122 /DNA_ID=CAMNT_0043327657 /DNA_START=81 /DNA_END=445 /DNA_ORIENTATION=+